MLFVVLYYYFPLLFLLLKRLYFLLGISEKNKTEKHLPQARAKQVRQPSWNSGEDTVNSGFRFKSLFLMDYNLHRFENVFIIVSNIAQKCTAYVFLGEVTCKQKEKQCGRNGHCACLNSQCPPTGHCEFTVSRLSSLLGQEKHLPQARAKQVRQPSCNSGEDTVNLMVLD